MISKKLNHKSTNIENTRSFDPNANLRLQLDLKIKTYESRRRHIDYRKRSRGLVKIETVDCTKCQRKMSKDFADKQLFYGKKDSPICIPCIEGRARKVLDLNKNDTRNP